MNPKPTLLDIPVRASVAVSVAAALRKAISTGSWKEFLPTERRLSEMLQVSRPTLRIALHLLAKEGLLEIIPGKGTKLIRQFRPLSPKRSQLVAVLAHRPVLELGLTYQGVNEMSSHLARQGFDTELLVCHTHGPALLKFVENYLLKNDVLCCVLLSVGEPLQRWFATHSIPALVLGSCHPNVELPSLDFDNCLVCRHAAAVFLQHGHRRLAFLVPDSGLAGDLASERGFREGVESHNGLGKADGRVVRHHGTAASIKSKLDSLLCGSSPATALLMANTEETFIVMMHLLTQGIPVPKQVSLISRDHNRIFEVMAPPVAHYKPEPNAFEHRLSRLMLQMVTQGHLKNESNLIVPTYFPGGTVRSC